jgi:DNA-binding transcriptional MocR family regulator
VPIILPPPPARRLTPAECGAVAKRGRKLLRRGLLTHRQLVLLDALLWSCRSPTTGALVVSYSVLQRLTHMARETVARAVQRLEELGLLSRIKRRIRESWHNGGTRTRQATNAYLLHPPPADHSESSGATVDRQLEILYVQVPTSAAQKSAREALRRMRKAAEKRLLALWQNRHSP